MYGRKKQHPAKAKVLFVEGNNAFDHEWYRGAIFPIIKQPD